MHRHSIAAILAAFVVSVSGLSAFAESSETTEPSTSAFSAGFGLSAGTPGIFHFDMILTGREHSQIDPGFMCSLSLVLPQALRGDAADSSDSAVDQKSENGDTTFLSAQFGIPFFIQKNDSLFFALSPVCGFGYYNIYRDNHRPDKSGWWLYGGAAADFRFRFFFAEAGLAYGANRHYYTIRLADHLSLLCRAGVMFWF